MTLSQSKSKVMPQLSRWNNTIDARGVEYVTLNRDNIQVTYHVDVSNPDITIILVGTLVQLRGASYVVKSYRSRRTWTGYRITYNLVRYESLQNSRNVIR
jgi:hypothetical protein